MVFKRALVLYSFVLVFAIIIAFCLGMLVLSKIEKNNHAKQKESVAPVAEQKDSIDFRGDLGFMDKDILPAGKIIKKGWKLNVDLVQEGQYVLVKRTSSDVGPEKVEFPELMGKKKGDCIIWMDISIPTKVGLYKTIYDVFKPSDKKNKIYSIWFEFEVK